ncbi:hypothetical protein ES707_22693 [subsurface metagenome]
MTLDELAKKHGVCSLELSKELEAKGYPQDKSLWYWYEYYNDIKEQNEYFLSRLNPDLIHSIKYAAPHATELAEMLKKFRVMFGVNDKGAWINYDTGETWSELNSGKVVLKADTLPNALARMVLYLLDKGIIKKEDL